MRLSPEEIEAIKRSFDACFQEGDIYIFGSRTDNSRKGGDIDIYISVRDKTDLVRKKINFLIELQRDIGEQKIDVVLDYGQDRLIDRVAREEGVRL